MRQIRALFLRIGALLQRNRSERELAAELESHLQMHIEDNLRAGMNPREARRNALIKLGGLEQTKELYRDRRGLPFLETLLQDLRFGLRTLRKNPGFTSVAILTLALGIGANAAIFSLVNSVLLRPLSYTDAQQLYVVREIVPQWARSYPLLAANLPGFQIWQKQCHSFEQIAIAESMSLDLSGAGAAQELHGLRASANLLDLLGMRPALGRAFLPEEDQAGHDRVVILTDSFWRSRFHADPSLVGQTITLDGEPHVVVGVLSPAFHFPKDIGSISAFRLRPDFLKPLGGPRIYEQDLMSEFDFAAIARLTRGVTPAQALAELNVIQANIAKKANEDLDLRAALFPLETEVVGSARNGLVLLLAAVSVVLLIVCVNLANLLLARVPGRMREAAIRTALGASPWRLIRQMLSESLLLALSGGILGLALASAGVRWLVHFVPADLPRLDEVTVDGRVLWFAFGLSVLGGCLFGILPAWRTSRAGPEEVMKVRNPKIGEGRGPRHIRQSLIGLEVGLCTALLILAGLLTSSLFHLIRVNPGFTVERVLTADVDLPPQKYSQLPARARFYDQVLAAVRTLPAVESTGWVTILPLEGQGSVTGISLPGAQLQSEEKLHANFRTVSPGYLQTMRIPLLAGRYLTDSDRGKKVVLVSKSVAGHLWPGQDPLGRECIAEWGQLQKSEVVGVVGDIRAAKLETPPLPMVYVPDFYGQMTPGPPESASFVVRTTLDPETVTNSVREIIRRTDPDVPVLALRPMSQVVLESVAQRRFQMLLSLLFAFSALLLASIGVFGVVAYSVAQRRHELGIRMAVGARGADILALILRQGMILVVVGLALGIISAFAGGQLVQSLLFGVRAFDPVTVISVVFLVAIVGSLACYLPARRATKIDPMVALRHE